MRAVTLGQLDDFQTAGVAGWGAVGNTFTTNVADAGPNGAGDNALDVDAQFRFIVNNETQWKGDYIAAGVTEISMDIQHANSFPLTLWLGIANGGFSSGGFGNTYASAAPVIVPNDGQWHHIAFDVTPAGFAPTSSNTANPPDASAALTNVTHLRLFHNPTAGQFIGAAIAGTFRLDNILAEGLAVADDADFDGDGDVDGRDFLVWQRNVGTGTVHTQGDADFNEAVDSADLDVWKEQFTAAVPPVAAIPEPSAAVLLSMSASLIWRSLRSRR